MQAKEIIEHKFSRAFRGYDIGEVDAFLDEILRDQERLDQEMQMLEMRNKMLLDELARVNPDYLPKKETAQKPEGKAEKETDIA